MIQLSSINRLNNGLANREALLGDGVFSAETPGVLVQTCNRLEFYWGDGDVPVSVIRHLYRVVSGLESSLLGEIAIQGQVKQAYLAAADKHCLSKGLHHLFQSALFVGKRVRTQSGISRGAMSHSQAAAEIIAKSGVDLNKAIISLIGAHKLNSDIIRFLQNKGAETIFLANKSFEKAEVVAKEHGCQMMRLDQLHDMLSFTNVLITATSAPHLIVKFDDFPRGRNMLIIDLAFPRDVDERIGNLPGVTLYNLETIETMVTQNLESRRCEILTAEKIIEEEILQFIEKQNRQVHYVNQSIQ